MKDKNGVEIHTGDIVEVKGGFYKSDNGLFYVKHSPRDADWNGNYYSLKRVGKSGKVSKMDYTTKSFPIQANVQDRLRRAELNFYNDKNSTIEVRKDINNQYVIEEFQKQIDEALEEYKWLQSDTDALDIEIREVKNEIQFLQGVINRMKENKR